LVPQGLNGFSGSEHHGATAWELNSLGIFKKYQMCGCGGLPFMTKKISDASVLVGELDRLLDTIYMQINI